MLLHMSHANTTILDGYDQTFEMGPCGQIYSCVGNFPPLFNRYFILVHLMVKSMIDDEEVI